VSIEATHAGAPADVVVDVLDAGTVVVTVEVNDEDVVCVEELPASAAL
jgi:hypothetical protein